MPEAPATRAPRASASKTVEELRQKIEDVRRGFGGESEEPEQAYHVGTLPGCPRWNIDLAGVNFPRTTELVEVVAGETQRTPRPGAIVLLTPSMYARVLTAIAVRVVRKRPATPEMIAEGKEDIGTVFVTNNASRPYRPVKGDLPLADFVYLERAPEHDGAEKPKYPESLAAALSAVSSHQAP